MNEPEPRVTISVDQKIYLGNYESASVGIILSSLPAGVTEAEIEALLDTGRLAYGKMVERLAEKVAARREAGR